MIMHVITFDVDSMYCIMKVLLGIYHFMYTKWDVPSNHQCHRKGKKKKGKKETRKTKKQRKEKYKL